MIIGTVVGSAVATAKVEKLIGQKFMLIRPGLTNKADAPLFVAVDPLGAGIGEKVLVTKGTAARELDETAGLPVDAVIVGIVNDYDINEEIE